MLSEVLVLVEFLYLVTIKSLFIVPYWVSKPPAPADMKGMNYFKSAIGSAFASGI